MGANGSHLKFPSFGSTECVAYATSRKHAAKDLVDAHRALIGATKAYSDSLKHAGASFVVFSAGTDLFAGTSLAHDATGAPPPVHVCLPGAPHPPPHVADVNRGYLPAVPEGQPGMAALPAPPAAKLAGEQHHRQQQQQQQQQLLTYAGPAAAPQGTPALPPLPPACPPPARDVSSSATRSAPRLPPLPPPSPPPLGPSGEHGTDREASREGATMPCLSSPEGGGPTKADKSAAPNSTSPEPAGLRPSTGIDTEAPPPKTPAPGEASSWDHCSPPSQPYQYHPGPDVFVSGVLDPSEVAQHSAVHHLPAAASGPTPGAPMQRQTAPAPAWTGAALAHSAAHSGPYPTSESCSTVADTSGPLSLSSSPGGGSRTLQTAGSAHYPSAGAVVPYAGPVRGLQRSLTDNTGRQLATVQSIPLTPLQDAPAQHQGSVAPMLGDKILDYYAKQLNALFLEASGLIKPLMEVLDMGPPLEKHSTPPMYVNSARLADGRPEPVGHTLQKLVNWERKLKDEAVSMDSIKAELRNKNKKLHKQTSHAAKKPGTDLRRLETAHHKVNDASARLASVTASLGSTYNELERCKSELLLPQVLRILPGFVALWQASASVFAQQQAVALQLARHEPPHVTRLASIAAAAAGGGGGSFQRNGPAARNSAAGNSAAVNSVLSTGALGLSQRDFAEAMGAACQGTSKAQHEATKKLQEAFQGLHKAVSELNRAQRQYCSALMSWIAKTKAFPSSFPRPPPGAPPSGQYVASWAAPRQPQPQPQMVVNKDHLFSALTGDWMRTLDRLPESDMHSAVSAFCNWLAQAYDLQKQEMKQAKKLEEASKQLSKQKEKLALSKQKERELQLAVAAMGEVSEGSEKEHQVKEHRAQAAAAELATVIATVEAARQSVGLEMVALERLVADGKVAVAGAVQRGLPVVFQQTTNFANMACHGYTLVQNHHAPWLAQAARG